MKVTLKRADWERILIVCAAALVVVLALRGGGDVSKETLYEEPPLTVTQTSAETSAPAEETLSTVCFYQDGEGYLIPVTRQIPKQDGIAKATLALMVKSARTTWTRHVWACVPSSPRAPALTLTSPAARLGWI